MDNSIEHITGLQNPKPLVYTAMSKLLFYFREHISSFVLERGGIPLNPFMIFGYFLHDTVSRDLVREGNNNLVRRSDEVWVFGAVSNGVLAEVIIAKERGIPVRYYDIQKPVSMDDTQPIVEIQKELVKMESPDLEQHRDKL